MLSVFAADDIVERYDNLSKCVSDRNEKLHVTLTRSMSVQDGLHEMMGWMEGVEASLKENESIPLDSAVLGDILSKKVVRFLLFIKVILKKQQHSLQTTLQIFFF